ncbi:hypothetical protein NLI96_g4479 [Meripilus lineatus]|uniref:N-acetyltransferase domain-containing protein n=1 Tax=Meripilus lineatus TaxID=2056292 RepID=A0AAD5YEQ2_9APHY|nr:hypothetical protein NLI96_g4479 [Physisporinus lineatus]
MSWVNNYKPPSPPDVLPESELFGPTPYDVNFGFPIHQESLETERVKLVPFIPSIHGQHYWDVTSKNLSVWRFYPFIHPSFEATFTFFERHIRQNPAWAIFAIIDKTKPDPEHPEFEGGSLAGVIGLLDTSTTNLSTEIGHVLVFPEFQKTHVASNAVGVLMKYCLDMPTASPPGLGLRRVSWRAHSKNLASKGLAEKMGFRMEGVIRWHWVLPEALATDGDKQWREGDPFYGKAGRHTNELSVCWDDWENGVRELVQSKIDRRV